MTIAELREIGRATPMMPEPADVAVRIAIAILQGRGVNLSEEEAVDWLKTFAAAEEVAKEQKPACCPVDARD